MLIPKKQKPEVPREKTCKCGKKFIGFKTWRYCPECAPGRKRAWNESRKQKLKGNQGLNLNVRLTGGKHILYCALCGEPYEIIADNSDIGNKYGNNCHIKNVYPKFCEEHRNEWKRKLYEKNHGATESAQSKTGTDHTN